MVDVPMTELEVTGHGPLFATSKHPERFHFTVGYGATDDHVGYGRFLRVNGVEYKFYLTLTNGGVTDKERRYSGGLRPLGDGWWSIGWGSLERRGYKAIESKPRASEAALAWERNELVPALVAWGESEDGQLLLKRGAEYYQATNLAACHRAFDEVKGTLRVCREVRDRVFQGGVLSDYDASFLGEVTKLSYLVENGEFR